MDACNTLWIIWVANDPSLPPQLPTMDIRDLLSLGLQTLRAVPRTFAPSVLTSSSLIFSESPCPDLFGCDRTIPNKCFCLRGGYQTKNLPNAVCQNFGPPGSGYAPTTRKVQRKILKQYYVHTLSKRHPYLTPGNGTKRKTCLLRRL